MGRFDKTVFFSLLVIHVIAFTCMWFTFSWQGCTACVVLYPITAMGITVGYHRLLTHESFETVTPIKRFLIFCGMTAAQGTPLKWVALHRMHHQYSDKPGDPHSPRHGYGHSHMFWVWQKLGKEDLLVCYNRYAKDLLEDSFIRFWSKPGLYVLWLGIVIVALFLLGWGIWDIDTGISLVVYGVFVRLVAVYHATWMVNSVCHLIGYTNYPSRDDSKNNPVVALLTFGEGWHGNHHAMQRAANHGHRWFEIDMSYWLIRSLEILRLAWNVQRAPAR